MIIVGVITGAEVVTGVIDFLNVSASQDKKSEVVFCSLHSCRGDVTTRSYAHHSDTE